MNNKKIIIAGASGFIGSNLIEFLKESNYKILRLVRRKAVSADEVEWHPESGICNISPDTACDVVINLAGANIASQRWSEARKEELWTSRIDSTRLIIESLMHMQQKPRLIINASAIGYYGSDSVKSFDEDSESADNFLANLCVEWEKSAKEAKVLGIRTVLARFGLVLGSDGGALKKMLLPFKLGLGGKIGSGEQFMSWISIRDLLRAMLFIIEQGAIEGAVNFVSPNPVNNLSFTKTLAQTLNRPALLPIPGAAVKLAFGEMGEALLLSSQKVFPSKLSNAGFNFKDPDIKTALSTILSE